MRTLFVVCLAFLSTFLYYGLALADTCSDYRQKTGFDLNDAECYVLEQVEKGEIAHFKENQRRPHGNYLKQFAYKEDRSLSADFLRNLLTGSYADLKVTYKGVRISNAHVSEALNFEGIKIPYPLSLDGFQFVKAVDFKQATFSGEASFNESKFYEEASFYGVTFSEGVSFEGVTFSDKVGFLMAKFSKMVSFMWVIFYQNVEFNGATFSNIASFWGTTFSEKASFLSVIFSKEAFFVGAKFSKGAFFGLPEFSLENFGAKFTDPASFKNVTFSGEVSFSQVNFLKEADFSSCRFKDEVKFGATYFPPDKILLLSIDTKYFDELNLGKIPDIINSNVSYKKIIASSYYGEPNILVIDRGNEWLLSNNQRKIVIRKDKIDGLLRIFYIPYIKFDNVTGFSNLQIEWQYGPTKFGKEKEIENIERRGLKNHLQFNETFYIALIKNYRDMGWLEEADDCYYTYRAEKRKHLLNKLNDSRQDAKDKHPASSGKFWKTVRLYGEYLLLDFTFGYGVKPLKIFRTFLILWVSFSFYYVGFLRSKFDRKLPWWKAWNPAYKPSRFTWALLYSLDKLTPAIKLDSLTTLNPNVFIKQNSKRVIYVERFQNLLGWYWFALFLILFSRLWIR